MKGLIAAALAAQLALAAPALASVAKTPACRAGLAPAGRLIFDTAAPQLQPKSDLRDLVRRTARDLVLKGQLTRKAAVDNAMPAGLCLNSLRNQG